MIQGKMVSQDTEVYNELEDAHYTAQPNGADVILKGTVGEEWVTKLEKVIQTYTKADGSELTAEDFTADTYIELKIKAHHRKLCLLCSRRAPGGGADLLGRRAPGQSGRGPPWRGRLSGLRGGRGRPARPHRRMGGQRRRVPEHL